MKFTLSRESLKQALARTSLLPSGKAVASAQFVKISAFIDTITLDRFSAESLIAVDCEASEIEEGEPIFVNSTSLQKLISGMPWKNVTIESSGDGKIRIGEGKLWSKLSVLDDIFFQPPKAPKGQKLQVQCVELNAALSGVSPAMSRDNSQGVLAGVGIRKINDRLTIFASDRRRWHSVTKDYKLDVDVVIPIESVEALARLMDGQDGETTITFGEGAIEAVCARSRAILPLMEEAFPKSVNVFMDVPSKSLEIRVSRAELLEAIKACALAGEGENKNISWEVKDGVIEVHANNRVDSEVTTEIPCIADGPSRAEFSSTYLSDAVSFIHPDKDGMITLEQTPQNAFFLRGQEKLAFVCLVSKQPSEK